MTNGYNTPIGVPIGLPSILSLGLPPLVNPYPTLNLDFINNPQFDSRITFSRGSQATLFDSTGTLRYAKHNLLLQSQNFTTTWGNTRSTDVADTDTAPDGTVTADSVLQASGQTDAGFVGQSVSVAIGEYVYSVFAKPNGKNFLILQENALDGTQNLTWFDVQNGTVGTTDPGHTPTITASTNGYYRCSIRFTVNAARTGTFLLRLADTNGSTTVVDNGAGLYLWGAQLEQRSAVTAYTATTTQPITNYIPVLLTAQNNVPRFDHNPTTDVALGLLIEEQRTNLFTYSEDFANAAWSKIRSSITSNTIVAPDGTLTADKLVEDTTASNSHLILQSSTATKNATYTFSFFAKAAERSFCRVFLNGYSGNNIRVSFDLTTGATSASGSSGTGSFSTAGAVSVGNGWLRCFITGIPSTAAGTGFDVQINLATDGTSSGDIYTGDGYSGIFIWGAQLEAGAFATSYIPTTTTALTRSADVADMTGTNFSSWFNASEFTVVSSFQRNTTANTATGGGNSVPRIYSFGTSAGGALQLRLFSSTGAEATGPSMYVATNWAAGQVVKHALAYAINNAALVYDGGAAATDTSVGPFSTVPDMFSIGANTSGTGNINQGWIQRIAYYNYRVPNAQLQALTGA